MKGGSSQQQLVRALAEAHRRIAELEALASPCTENEFLLNVLESLSHPFYVVDTKDYRILLANTAARLDTLSGEAMCYALTHRRDQPCGTAEHPCPLEEVKRTRKPVVVEHIHYDEDGHVRSMEIHAYPLLDSHGDVIQRIAYGLDITGRKQAEEDLRSAHDALEQRMQERTPELARTNEELRVEITEHQRTAEHLQKALRREEAMGRIRDRIIAVQDLFESRGDLGRYCIEELRSLGLPIDAVTLQFPSTDPDTFITLFPFARKGSIHRSALSDFPWVKEVWDRGAPVVVSRARLDAVGFGHPETQCILGVPLPGEGSLEVSSQVSNAFDGEAIRTVEAAAGLIGEGLQRLDVLESLHKREEALRRSNEELVL